VTSTYPLDIVRTRLSIQSASFKELKVGDGPREKLPGMFALMVKMTKTEGGWTALYRGIIPTVAGVAPYVCFGGQSYVWVLTRIGWLELYGLRDYARILYERRR
jgi:solute carrier family 25 phosphate transporter 23/24/25/41